MSKRYIICLLLLCLALSTMAVPALRVRRSVTLDDGRTVMVTSRGDEDFDFLLTDDGEVVLEQDGVFHATGMFVEQYFEAMPPLPRYARRQVGSVASALVKPTGVKRIPVILTAFKDKPFTVASSDQGVKAFYERFFNGNDPDIYASTGNWGSIRQYFIDQSLGQFQPEFSVIGPVELDSAYAYYGKDYKSGRKDSLYSKFVLESFTKALAIENDWSQFDNDGNGKVDMCVIIFAGLGQNYTNSYGDKNTIWPQEMPASYTINGITLSGCSSTCEMHPTAHNGQVITAWQPDGVGVAIHEISHALGLPDLYDKNYREFGLDYWSIMDYGMYARASKVPVGYTAYEREFMGWQQTETVNEPRTLRLSCFDRGGKGYKIVNDANPNEYYILDNRQATGWDWGACSNRGHGMLVYHVDYKSSIWLSNNVNTLWTNYSDSTKNHYYQSLTIIPANGRLIGSNNATTQSQWQTSLKGNPYPGITENHELTDESYPASIVYTGGFMGKPLVDIEETEDSIITLKVMPLGTLESPTGLAFEDVSVHKAKAVWDEVSNAELYNLQLWSEGELVFRQDSIAGNSFQLSDLQANRDYTIAVQAISDSYRNSEWAESGSFRDILTAISEMTASTERVRIYDLNGRYIGACFADELYRFYLKHGIYVVRRANGKSMKIMK